MNFISITNPGEIPLHGIRLLGQSSKRGTSKIGQFGTGLKEIIALTLREEIPLTIFSGLEKITFSIEEIEGQREVCFTLTKGSPRFEKNKPHPMGFSPLLGELDWTSPWQVLRETICNAYDEDPELFATTIVSEDALTGTPGATKVFIGATRPILQEYASIHSKLLFLDKKPAIVSLKTGSLYPPSTEGRTTFFHKEVFISEGDSHSLFDYELNTIKLNESRTVSQADCLAALPTLLAHLPVEHISSIWKLFEKSAYDIGDTEGEVPYNSYFESRVSKLDLSDIITRNRFQARWKESFLSLYGPKAVVCTTSSHMQEKLTCRGYVPICFSSNLVSFAKRLGIPSHTTILSDDERSGRDVIPTPDSTKELFSTILDKLEGILFNIRPQIKVYVCRANDSFTGNLQTTGDKIYISENILGSRKEAITLLQGLFDILYISPEDNARVMLDLIGVL